MAIKGAALLLWPPLREELLLGVAVWVGAGLCLVLLPASPLPEARAGASRQRSEKTGSAWEGGQLFFFQGSFQSVLFRVQWAVVTIFKVTH